jgi:hypothetical protein
MSDSRFRPTLKRVPGIAKGVRVSSVTNKKDEIQMDNLIGETMYLLKKWQISASSTGLLWVKPLGTKLSPEELASFLTLLSRTCERDMPRAILFDFNEVEIVGGQWTVIESLMNDCARTLEARCRIVSAPRRPISAFLLYQHESDAAGMQQSTPAA